ncbi:MAG TPA: hypothetical protein VMG98_08590 [Verrucomicrobiae bacterium]|nr:hypothetical protein [Verrucomicrobiae bacterium]
MTAIEQIQSWAQAPDNELFIGVGVRDEPYVVSRARARVIADRFTKMAEGGVARVEAIKGINCVVVDLVVAASMVHPNAPDAACRLILSPVEPFA